MRCLVKQHNLLSFFNHDKKENFALPARSRQLALDPGRRMVPSLWSERSPLAVLLIHVVVVIVVVVVVDRVCGSGIFPKKGKEERREALAVAQSPTPRFRLTSRRAPNGGRR